MGRRDYFAQILRDYIGRDVALVGVVGNCTAELLEAQSFVDFATRWIEDTLE